MGIVILQLLDLELSLPQLFLSSEQIVVQNLYV